MQTSETRIVNQCTYTPIELSNNDTPQAQPFVFQGILGFVFDEPEITKEVLERMKVSQKPGLDDPPSEYLITAVKSMWAGDLETSITELNKVNSEQVRQFAKSALKIEREVIEKSKRGLTDIYEVLINRNGAQSDKNNKLSQDIAMMRESIMADVKSMINTPKPDVVQTNIRNQESGRWATKLEAINTG